MAYVKYCGLSRHGYSSYRGEESIIYADVTLDNTYKAKGFSLLSSAVGRVNLIYNVYPNVTHRVRMRRMIVVSDVTPSEIWKWRYYAPLGVELERIFSIQRFYFIPDLNIIPVVCALRDHSKGNYVDHYDYDLPQKRRKLS